MFIEIGNDITNVILSIQSLCQVQYYTESSCHVRLPVSITGLNMSACNEKR